MPAAPTHPVLLVVLDGWGIGDGGPHDAIAQAGCANMRRWSAGTGFATLGASGIDVGLPPGQMGNSEVGHLNIGAGRRVPQDIVRIGQAIADGSFARNETLGAALAQARGARLHVVGLLGPGGVHSHSEHALAVVRVAADAGVSDVAVHHLLDGRDTPPRSALAFADDFQRGLDAIGTGVVATLAGRYWTMDRDARWDRTLRGYKALVDADAPRRATAADAIARAYAKDVGDEFVEPVVVGQAKPMRDGDVVLWTNFRADRVRQPVRILCDPEFRHVERRRPDVKVYTMTMYDETFAALGVRPLFEPIHPLGTLGQVYADRGLSQLRVAETEKYAHVTYFFNGRIEPPLAGEERRLIPSAMVATYDKQPQMSAGGVAAAVHDGVQQRYPLIVANFANADMVGHTGMIGPTIEACRAVDDALGDVVSKAKQAGYVVGITADHGNAEAMIDQRGQPLTAHTTARVPFCVLWPDARPTQLAAGGCLADVAPTLLAAAGFDAPPEMTGRSLLRP